MLFFTISMLGILMNFIFLAHRHNILLCNILLYHLLLLYPEEIGKIAVEIHGSEEIHGGGHPGVPSSRGTCRVSDGATPVSRGRLIGVCI